MHFYRTLVTLLIIYISLNILFQFRFVQDLDMFDFIVYISQIIFLIFISLHSVLRLGWRNTLALFSIILVGSFMFEAIGVSTGYITGQYYYTYKIGTLLFGLVPYSVPFAWLMMIYPSYIMSLWIMPAKYKFWKHTIIVASITGLVMTSWDLVMDPVMVNQHYWIWESKGLYFGIPLQNYAAWWFVTFTLIMIYHLFLKISDSRLIVNIEIPTSFDKLMLVAYAFTGIMYVQMAYVLNLPGPAAIGFVSMLFWVILVLRLMRRNKINGYNR